MRRSDLKERKNSMRMCVRQKIKLFINGIENKELNWSLKRHNSTWNVIAEN